MRMQVPKVINKKQHDDCKQVNVHYIHNKTRVKRIYFGIIAFVLLLFCDCLGITVFVLKLLSYFFCSTSLFL